MRGHTVVHIRFTVSKSTQMKTFCLYRVCEINKMGKSNFFLFSPVPRYRKRLCSSLFHTGRINMAAPPSLRLLCRPCRQSGQKKKRERQRKKKKVNSHILHWKKGKKGEEKNQKPFSKYSRHPTYRVAKESSGIVKIALMTPNMFFLLRLHCTY